MRQRLLIALTIFLLAPMFLCSEPAQADWLGLAPGDYNVTLDGSSSLCGGSNCLGTVHIGFPGATGFDWLFSFTSPAAATFDCGASCSSMTDINTGRQVTIEDNFAHGEQFGLIFDPTSQSRTYGLFNGTNGLTIGTGGWEAVSTAVPEPSSLLLLSIGVLGLRARVRRR